MASKTQYSSLCKVAFGTLNVHDNFLVNSFSTKIKSIFQQ